MRPTPAFELDALCVFEDETCLVFDKPSGLPSVPGKGPWLTHNLCSLAQARWPELAVVHRLDMATSGLLLFARGPQWQRHYSQLFAQRQMQKTYVAVVQGEMPAAQGRIEAPLMADWPNRPRQKVDVVHGKPSVTDWHRMGWQPERNCSRLSLSPITGRSHQLRVHLAHMGHPIWGDALYAPEDIQELSPRLLLHAQSLAFSHPLTGQPIELNCKAPF